MGKNNQQRRAARAKARARQRARQANDARQSEGGRSREGPFGFDRSRPLSPLHYARGLWDLAVRHEGGSRSEWVHALERLDPRVVDRAAESLLVETVAMLWDHGWQPVELQRQGRLRGRTVTVSRLLDQAIAAEHEPRDTRTLDPRWLGQLKALPLPATPPRWLSAWREREAMNRAEAAPAVIDALALLRDLPSLDQLIPPPGTDHTKAASSARSTASNPLLQRIRNLLAKAESTEFEAEAIALTAKAQELMTRHAIDLALLESERESTESPSMVRIPVDAPYADTKSLLLQTIAQTSRCRAAFSAEVAMSHLVGYPDDLSAVELLFTSLLVQAQHSLTETARNAAPGTRTRSQAYRSSFLLAFTHRVGDRLTAANDQVYAETEADSARYLPVLRAREDEVADFVTEKLGALTSSSVRGGYDHAGWADGTQAGDRAQLAFGDLEGR